MLMLLKRKRLLMVYMGCMAAACLLAYNLLPPVNHDNVPRLRMLQDNSANDSTADLTLLLDQIDEHLQQVRAQNFILAINKLLSCEQSTGHYYKS